MDYFLGVDAGGTGTRALLFDATGAVRGVGVAGAGNWQAVGAGAAGAAVAEAVCGALDAAQVAASLPRGVFLALAGVRTESEREMMRAETAKLGFGGALEIGGDLDAAHEGALAGEAGVVVIAGTGSASWGRSETGMCAQAGGWGWLVDDKAGAYWLAIKGLAAAVEGEDGRGGATVLGARAAGFFGAAGLREVLRELHAGKRDRAAVAGFGREVFAAAEAGDVVAAGLLDEAAVEVLRLAEAVRAKIAPEGVLRLAVTGGLGSGLRSRVAERSRAAGFVPTVPWGDPVIGAALRAARAGGARLDADARARLLAGWKQRS